MQKIYSSLRAYINGKMYVNIFAFFSFFTKKMAPTAQLA